MTISVHEVLKLKKFNKFKLIAGAGGLDRRVDRGGFIDHESIEKVKISFDFEREMTFSSFPMIKDTPELITEYIKAFIEVNCACLAIKTVFFDEIPQSAIDLANEKNFPLFIFDETYIEKLIIEIDVAVNQNKRMDKVKGLIYDIEHKKMNRFTIRESAREINYNFANKVQSMYIQGVDPEETLDVGLIQKVIGAKSMIVPYDNHYLIIFSMDTNSNLNIERLLETLGIDKKAYHVGISMILDSLESLDQALSQGKSSLMFAVFKRLFLAAYDDLGIYQLLMPLLENPVLAEYYLSTVETLKAYDQVHNAQLLETAVAYIDCGGKVKETGAYLYQHANTIRFRVRKIYSVLQLEKYGGMAYESLAMSIHIHKLLDSSRNLKLK